MKPRILISLFTGFLVLIYSNGNAQNMVVDGDFSATTAIPINPAGTPAGGWYGFQNAGTDALPAVESGVCHYTITTPGANTWEVQIAQWGFTQFVIGNTYRLSFDVKADADRWFGVFLGEEGGGWFSLLGMNQYWQPATTGWRTITLEFTVCAVFPWHKLSFEIGGSDVDMYFDNVVLEDLGKLPIRIGILGSALFGWENDVDLTSADEVLYTLENCHLNSGYVKFRQNDSWVINWGAEGFPSGMGFQDGPDIPVYTPGNFNITFNRLTGEYFFVCAGECAPHIGLLGTAVPPEFGWINDQPLWSFDGINYGNLHLLFSAGEAMFRLNDDPAQMWGGNTFPDGVAVPGGTPIPVPFGQYEVNFNLVTGEYHFTLPSVGILGSALNGWDEDINLQTTDGILYTLTNYPFSEGLVKFRLNDSWDANWGGEGFPSGGAIWNGPNIPVMAGTYNVTFNLLEGYYIFEATTCPVPAIHCPKDILLPNDPGLCGAKVWYPDILPIPNCGGKGVKIKQTAGLPSGSFFPVGTTTNSFLLTNENGLTVSCSFNVVVIDKEPPVIGTLTAEYNALWPPNHKLIPVALDYTTSDNCGKTRCEILIDSSEAVNGTGDGNTTADFEVSDDHLIHLRMERSGPGEGRTYSVVVICSDESGNTTTAATSVFIPHDAGTQNKAGLKSAAPETNQPVDFTYQVWPNPSKDYFNLKVEMSTDTERILTVSDYTGRAIAITKLCPGQVLQFGHDLVPGLYLLGIREGSSVRTFRITKL